MRKWSTWLGLRAQMALLWCIALTATSAASTPKRSRGLGGPSAFDKLLRDYTFVGDFGAKPAERHVSDELFWRYPLKVPPATFDLEPDLSPAEVPATKDDGAAPDDGLVYQFINRARLLYLQGQYAEAAKTWLAAKARYGTKYKGHRRTDYFIGFTFLKLADLQRQQLGLSWQAGVHRAEVGGYLSNASTFLSYAFIVKKDEETADAFIEKITPKALYNLAAIYWVAGHADTAFGAATQGLDFLRATGRKDYRSRLRRIVAESYVANHTYLDAVQEFDTAIRQDPDPFQAAGMFARVGDIYFDLNNYDLAEDAYSYAGRAIAFMDSSRKKLAEPIDPTQFVLRGEALFWLGRFSEAQKTLQYALDAPTYKSYLTPLPTDYGAYALLRIADAWLARKNNAKATLAYFRVSQEFPGTAAAAIAKVRSACLELPAYDGFNVQHARALLERAKGGSLDEPQTPPVKPVLLPKSEKGEAAKDASSKDDKQPTASPVEAEESSTKPDPSALPPEAIELAWACQTESYAQRERTPAMLDRVRHFAEQYPESRYLKLLREPVREVQASHLDELFAQGKTYEAVSYFEKTRALLFKTESRELGAKLFVAYLDSLEAAKAAPFWPAYKKIAPDDDLKALREVVMKTEIGKGDQTSLAATLNERHWAIGPEPAAQNYVSRVLATKDAKRHLPWIYNLASHWASGDATLTCSLLYPVMSRIVSAPEVKRTMTPRLREGLAKLIAADYPSLLDSDPGCGISILELERNISNVATLAERYGKREDWLQKPGVPGLFWAAAESAYAAGKTDAARKLWKALRDKAPKDAPEAKFAASRLDEHKTEFEQLWQ